MKQLEKEGKHNHRTASEVSRPFYHSRLISNGNKYAKNEHINEKNTGTFNRATSLSQEFDMRCIIQIFSLPVSV